MTEIFVLPEILSSNLLGELKKFIIVRFFNDGFLNGGKHGTTIFEVSTLL